jgi:hypothetical protein
MNSVRPSTTPRKIAFMISKVMDQTLAAEEGAGSARPEGLAG